VATKLDMAWTRERDTNHSEYDSDRWPPFASICLATISSVVLWMLIIQGVVRLF
jgi:hypothetical protein